jgi:hypothetical protein
MDTKRLAVEYYFGDLQYWKLPRIAVAALEEGYDGPALRALASIDNPVVADMEGSLIDSAFREMGIDAPITKNQARLALASNSVARALNGSSSVFDEATHIRIHLCELNEPPDALRQIFDLAAEARNAHRSRWVQLEQELTQAFMDFLAGQ